MTSNIFVLSCAYIRFTGWLYLTSLLMSFSVFGSFLSAASYIAVNARLPAQEDAYNTRTPPKKAIFTGEKKREKKGEKYTNSAPEPNIRYVRRC